MSTATPQDKRRIVASISALIAIPFYSYCGAAHFCIGGHMAHPPYQWWDLANEYVWITFLSIALVLSFRSNIPSKKTFIGFTSVMLASSLVYLSILMPLAALGLLVVSIKSLRPKRQTRNQNGQASKKTIERDFEIRDEGASSEAPPG